jgi:hypothetical protein
MAVESPPADTGHRATHDWAALPVVATIVLIGAAYFVLAHPARRLRAADRQSTGTSA